MRPICPRCLHVGDSSGLVDEAWLEVKAVAFPCGSWKTPEAFYESELCDTRQELQALRREHNTLLPEVEMLRELVNGINLLPKGRT